MLDRRSDGRCAVHRIHFRDQPKLDLNRRAGNSVRHVCHLRDDRGARKSHRSGDTADQKAELADQESPAWAVGAGRAYLPYGRADNRGAALTPLCRLGLVAEPGDVGGQAGFGGFADYP